MKASKSILIVDDEYNLRTTLTWILQRAGYTTRSASSGQEALNHLRHGKFDLVFMDLKMPGMDGLQLLPEIRLLDPDLPVLVLTANGSLETAVEALRTGAYGYLLKPIEPEQIITRLNEVFYERSHIQRRQRIVDEIKEIMTELKEMEI